LKKFVQVDCFEYLSHKKHIGEEKNSFIFIIWYTAVSILQRHQVGCFQQQITEASSLMP
jgi:hypothetical protein